jgi:hypothetical protein
MVPVNADAYNLTADLATMADKSNVVTICPSQAARDALTLYTGRLVMRTDLPSNPVFRYDGTVWQQITGLHHAEYTGPAFATTAGTGTNFSNGTGGTPFAADSSKTFNNDFVQPDVGGCIKILQTGEYNLFGIILPTTLPASFSLTISDITNVATIANIGGVGYGVKEQSITASGVYIAANTVVQFGIVTSNAVTIGSRIRITKVQ